MQPRGLQLSHDTPLTSLANARAERRPYGEARGPLEKALRICRTLFWKVSEVALIGSAYIVVSAGRTSCEGCASLYAYVALKAYEKILLYSKYTYLRYSVETVTWIYIIYRVHTISYVYIINP